MEKISRETALQLGLKRYFTGVPCMRGHICERRAIGRDCVECGRLAERAVDPERARLRNQYFQPKRREPGYELVRREWRARQKTRKSATGEPQQKWKTARSEPNLIEP
jgi:hypothetical protein